MEKTNYITRGTGYTALLAAIIEQAREDIKKATKRGDALEVTDALNGIAEWREEVESNLNFKVYE